VWRRISGAESVVQLHDHMDWTITMTNSLSIAVAMGVPFAVGGIVLAAGSPVPDGTALRRMTARFAPVEIGTDVASLPSPERQVLGKLVQAARVIDALFVRQVWAGNEALLLDLIGEARGGDLAG
jgi:hypothetical protein